jgi:hypothetical protein
MKLSALFLLRNEMENKKGRLTHGDLDEVFEVELVPALGFGPSLALNHVVKDFS